MAQWGPREVEHRKAWLRFREENLKERNARTEPKWRQLMYTLIRKSHKKDQTPLYEMSLYEKLRASGNFRLSCVSAFLGHFLKRVKDVQSVI